MPSIAATPLTFDEGHVCSACRVYGQRRDIDWDERRGWLEELVGEYRSERNYDVVIPVSGGQDSYFQTHSAINEHGLKPPLVTYHCNTYLTEGEYNHGRQRRVFHSAPL